MNRAAIVQISSQNITFAPNLSTSALQRSARCQWNRGKGEAFSENGRSFGFPSVLLELSLRIFYDYEPRLRSLLGLKLPQEPRSTVAMANKVVAPTQRTTPSNFKLIITRPTAIVIDLLGVLVCRSFMTGSKEFRDFLQHNVLEYLNENWKVKNLKIMINFFRCSQQNVPDECKLADREEPREEQIKQAKKHVIWKLRNDPTSSALSLFMLGIAEWGYKNRLLVTQIYDDVPVVLKYWKEAKIPVYVGVGSADFLIMVLTNTNHGNILPLFNGHMNIMDFDGNKANKDFKKLIAILRCQPDRVLYLTRFRQDCRRAMEMGMQSLIVLRPDFDTHGLIDQLKLKRSASTSIDGTKMVRGAGLTNDTASPPSRSAALDKEVAKNPEVKKQFENNYSCLSLIDEHDENAQSSQILEQDLVKYSIVLSLYEIAMK